MKKVVRRSHRLRGINHVMMTSQSGEGIKAEDEKVCVRKRKKKCGVKRLQTEVCGGVTNTTSNDNLVVHYISSSSFKIIYHKVGNWRYLNTLVSGITSMIE